MDFLEQGEHANIAIKNRVIDLINQIWQSNDRTQQFNAQIKYARCDCACLETIGS